MPLPAELAALLRPPAPPAPPVVDGPLTLEVVQPDEPGAVRLHLSTVDGSAVVVEFAAAAAGRQSVEAAVTGCSPQCRLVAVEVVRPAASSGRATTVELLGLTQAGATVLEPGAIAVGDPAVLL